uniref:Uncharacterized protein n=1 Tax=Oryzias latipes TaxID=8090 RepID=A0A3B3H6J2_ORYLA
MNRLTGFSKKLTSACSVRTDSSSASKPPSLLPPPSPAGFGSSSLVTSDLRDSPRWPASPICRTRLVTLAMDRVLQNWMNSLCVEKKKSTKIGKKIIIFYVVFPQSSQGLCSKSSLR